MQGTLPVRVTGTARRRRTRRRYLVAGLVVLLVTVSSVVAFVLLRASAPEPPKPSPEVVKLAAGYQYRDTLSNVFGPLAWSPDGSRLATSSHNTLLIRDASSDRPRQRSVPYALTINTGNTNVGGIAIPGAILWSPDSRLLALDEPGGLVPHTITLVDAEEARILQTIRVPAPPEPPGKSSGGIEPMQSMGMHVLLGWANSGRDLVTLIGVTPGSLPGMLGLPYAVPTVLPTSAASNPPPTPALGPVLGPVAEIYCYVLDTETGDLVRSVQIYSSTAPPRIYSMALSPSGDALAFAWYDDRGVYPGPTTHLNLDVWDLRNGKLGYSVPNLQVNTAYSYPDRPDQYLAWSPDGATLYFASEETVKVIEAATGKILRTLPGVVPPTYTPVPPPTIPPTQVGPAMPQLPIAVSTAGPGQPGAPLVPLPDIFGRLFPQSGSGFPPTPTPDPNRYYPVGGIKLSPDGEHLAVFDSMTLRMWDLASGSVEMLTAMPGISPGFTLGYSGPPPPGIPPPFVAWSADNRLLATFARNYGGSIWLVDPKTGGHLRILTPYANNMVWSPATNMMAMHINTSVEIWGSNSGPPGTESPPGHPTP